MPAVTLLGLFYFIFFFPDELKKMNKKMEEVKTCDIQVLPEDFIDEVKDGGAVALISNRNISSWGSDVSTPF
jgi:hypothetical protein